MAKTRRMFGQITFQVLKSTLRHSSGVRKNQVPQLFIILPFGAWEEKINNLKPPEITAANKITWFNLLIQIYILNDKQCSSRCVGLFRSHFIWIYTVYKGSAYRGSAGTGQHQWFTEIYCCSRPVRLIIRPWTQFFNGRQKHYYLVCEPFQKYWLVIKHQIRF